MKIMNGKGQLIFESQNYNNSLNIEWELMDGDEIAEGKSWKANIGFYTMRVGEHITTPIFKALSSGSIKTKIKIESGKIIDCSITDILNLADDGIIEVCSSNFPSGKMTWDENAKLD